MVRKGMGMGLEKNKWEGKSENQNSMCSKEIIILLRLDFLINLLTD